jgi:hypothetical protein
MNSLYNNEDNYKINEDGTHLDCDTRKLIEALFDEWVHVRGFSPREVSQIMQGTIQELELTTVCGWRGSNGRMPNMRADS